MTELEIKNKLKRLYPNEDFRYGDQVTLSSNYMIEYYGDEKYTIVAFVEDDVVGKILIKLNTKFSHTDDYYIHPTHLFNITNRRRLKMKRLIL